MSEFLSIMLSAALVNNLVLVQLLGVSSLIAYSGRLVTAMELAIASFVVMVLGNIINLLLYRFLLTPAGLQALSLVIFVAVGALITTGLVVLINHYLPGARRRHQLEYCLLAANSAILGLALTSLHRLYDAIGYLAWIVGSALGFSLLLIAFAALSERLAVSQIPYAFRGAPAQLICAGLIAMSLLGFAGLA